MNLQNHQRHCEERSDEAIHLSLDSLPDGLLRFARNDGENPIDRHPEGAASSAALEGRRPRSILRGSQGLAPQDDDYSAAAHKN